MQNTAPRSQSQMGVIFFSNFNSEEVLAKALGEPA